MELNFDDKDSVREVNSLVKTFIAPILEHLGEGVPVNIGRENDPRIVHVRGEVRRPSGIASTGSSSQAYQVPELDNEKNDGPMMMDLIERVCMDVKTAMVHAEVRAQPWDCCLANVRP